MKVPAKPNLRDLRSSQDWERLEHRYYRDLGILDIMHSIESFKWKRTISREAGEKNGTYYVGYVDDELKLLRLDYVGPSLDYVILTPHETYIVYDGDLPVGTFQFRTGRRSGVRKVEDDFLMAVCTYTYGECNVLQGLVRQASLESTFGRSVASGAHRLEYYRYEHDQQGLLRIYLRSEGVGTTGHPFSRPEITIYDRQRDEMLANHTISKQAWIPVAKTRRNSIAFQFGGLPPANLSIPVCPECGAPLTHICTVALDMPLRSQLSLSVIPVFYCFDCLKPASTTDCQAIERPLPFAEVGCDAFPELSLQLVRSTEPEHEQEALIKLGGLPDWVQDEEYPTCGTCGKTMVFVGQINSDESMHSRNQALMFGDLGRLYVFACCGVVTTVMQCS